MHCHTFSTLFLRTFLTALAMGSMVSADVIIIDDFTEPSSRNITSRGQQAWVDVTGTVIGGIRDGSAGCESSDADGTTTARISAGIFSILTNKKASPSIYLAYDQTAGWGTHLDNDPFNGVLNPAWDLSDNGSNDRFSILFSKATSTDSATPFFNDFLLTVKVKGDPSLYQRDMDTAANAWMVSNKAALAAGSPVAFEIFFTDLGDGVDLSQVEGFSLHICSENRDMEYAIDRIAAIPDPAGIPEPAVATLVLLFGIGTLSVKRLLKR